MTAVPQPSWTAPPRRARRAGQVVALLAGVLLLLPGLSLMTGGGIALWAHHLNRSDGFVVSPEERFTSPGSALVSQQIDLRAGPDWVSLPELGTARIEVSGGGADEIFVGIAPVDDATAYLAGVSRTVVEGLGFDAPARADDQVAGGVPPAPPTAQDFWIAQATGAGPQEVSWAPAEGDWMFVVMNADGSPGVDVRARIGAELPTLAGIGWGLLVGGAIVTGLGVVVLPKRRRPADPWPPVPAIPPQRGPFVGAQPAGTAESRVPVHPAAPHASRSPERNRS